MSKSKTHELIQYIMNKDDKNVKKTLREVLKQKAKERLV
jgi:hypothetical protein